MNTNGDITVATRSRATIEDLARVPEKAEIVRGEIVRMSPTGRKPGYAGDEIFVSLREHVRRTKQGRAVGDNKAFHVTLPERESFSPDAAYYEGPNSGMKFYEGAPRFAAEVRSEGDYGAAAEREMAQKRADYFQAGTLVVWDVDLLNADVVRVYRHDDPDHPAVYRRGDLAEAEPAVPGWRMPVNDLFEDETGRLAAD
jgi:Uma2 family endonuclease